LLIGLLAGRGVDITLIGDASLSRRPMRRVTEPLTRMGARITTTDAGTPPVHIHPRHHLQPIDYAMPMASAQVKSALLLAGLNADGTTRITEPRVTRDHTERMLRTFGVAVDSNGRQIGVTGPVQLHASALRVPGDLSSAAFFIVAAVLAEDSSLTLRDVGVNPTRIGVIDILKAMGAQIAVTNLRQFGDEPVADLEVRSSRLHGTRIGADLVAAAVDEIPIVALAATQAAGETVISGAEELRVKESDRIAGVAAGLRALGADVSERDDGLVIRQSVLNGGTADSLDDHRLAMTFAVAALVCNAPVSVRRTANVATSFPDFPAFARRAGLGLTA